MSRLAERLDAWLATHPPRAGSLAITVFGDTVSQHGNVVWLGSLVTLLEQFGLNARQIRTAVFRLGREGWLDSEQTGRRSYLGLSAAGLRRYERAARRIYAAGQPPWDGHWTLVMPAGLDAAGRETLRRELGWQGFGQLGSGVLAHPRADEEAVRETLEALDASGSTVTWRAEALSGAALGTLVAEAWPLEAIAARYESFLEAFGALRDAAGAQTPAPREAFRLRTLLVHEYRRILLKATDLPPALLPRGWPGHAAARLAAALYRRVQAAAIDYARAELQDREGPLPAAGRAYHARFGGLDTAAAHAA